MMEKQNVLTLGETPCVYCGSTNTTHVQGDKAACSDCFHKHLGGNRHKVATDDANARPVEDIIADVTSDHGTN
jgi:DNA-directed RNA polymerase subunit RPC12/RpoP